MPRWRSEVMFLIVESRILLLVYHSCTDVQSPHFLTLSEHLGPVASGDFLLIINAENHAAPRFLHLNTHRGHLAIGTSAAISGHAAAVGALSVAAVDVATTTVWDNFSFIGGTANPIEPFSADGPRRSFFDANGHPLTPNQLLAPGGVLRLKPDLAAAGVSTSTPGFATFFGTSAAAPHAAAIAALVWSTNPAPGPFSSQLDVYVGAA